MATIAEQIKEIEDEIFKTQKNKATEHHLGKLKAKIAKLRDEQIKQQSAGGAGVSFAVRKSGNATIGLVGLPSVGKSTLLNKITNAKSEIGDYAFTTLDVVPGVMEYKGAKIQVLDLPGIIKGAAAGKGRGREILSVVRTVDLICLMVDAYDGKQLDVITKELWDVGLRLNQRPPGIIMAKTQRGGVNVATTVNLTKTDVEMVEDIAAEYRIINADIIIREDVDTDQLIDFFSENRIYVPAIVVMSKADLTDKNVLTSLKKRYECEGFDTIAISAQTEAGIENLKDALYGTLEFIRIYLKPRGGKPDFNEPLVVKSGSDVGMICNTLHRDFYRKFRYATVSGPSSKFPDQRVGLEHTLLDGDVLTIIVRK
ncbi:MAG: GTP-binding protein [Thermoplasmata archaeon HGW-Thermoplasmata-1]|nr:MAG: GTP-binding protein [Thermoplasmata archaeon HGW-Thermoplasmata-1]